MFEWEGYLLLKKSSFMMVLALILWFNSCNNSTSSDEDKTNEMTLSDIDGNMYKAVKIGEQWWMAENLKVTHYRNGEAIAKVTDGNSWEHLQTAAYCVYENDDGKIAKYGLLYNWFAVSSPQNIAPDGWHVPTDDDWKKLEIYLGMDQSIVDSIYWRGVNEGYKLKSVSDWTAQGGGSDEYDFAAIPGGFRDSSGGSFYGMGLYVNFWSQTDGGGNNAWYRYLNYNHSQIYRAAFRKSYGFSIRCVKD